MLRRRYYPEGDSGEVRAYLDLLRRNGATKKAAQKLGIDIRTLEMFWPDHMNVPVRILRGWEPLREIKRSFDGIGYRIFFCVKRDELWLLSAYEKGSVDTPRRELEKAYQRMRLVLGGSH